MFGLIFKNLDFSILTFLGIIFAYIFTGICIKVLQDRLPKDGGRAFAHDGKLSQGKPRGAGIIFILVFVLAAVLFLPMNEELLIYLIITIAAMLTGYFDDRSETPWNEYKKGLLDFVIAIAVGATYLNFNSNVIQIVSLGKEIAIPSVIFLLLVVILVWASINVTNCTDGVDGLSGTLSVVTLMTIYFISNLKSDDRYFNVMILMFVVCILGYLWFNATPSKLMMGDAGSRAIGLFIAIAILKTGCPLLYIPVAIVIIVDGGLGLVKLFLKRFLKISILKNTRTPIHDHVRKNLGWSNTQVVFKFAIIQIMVGFAVVWLIR